MDNGFPRAELELCVSPLASGRCCTQLLQQSPEILTDEPKDDACALPLVDVLEQSPFSDGVTNNFELLALELNHPTIERAPFFCCNAPTDSSEPCQQNTTSKHEEPSSTISYLKEVSNATDATPKLREKEEGVDVVLWSSLTRAEKAVEFRRRRLLMNIQICGNTHLPRYHVKNTNRQFAARNRKRGDTGKFENSVHRSKFERRFARCAIFTITRYPRKPAPIYPSQDPIPVDLFLN